MHIVPYKNKLNLKNKNPIGSWSYNTTLLGRNDPTSNPDPKNLSHVYIEFMADSLFSRSCSSLYDWGVLWLWCSDEVFLPSGQGNSWADIAKSP